MKRYTTAQVRARLSDALDEAEAGTPVVIERKGVRFRLVCVPSRPRAVKRAPLLEILDPAVERGQWTWTPAPGRLHFKARSVPRRKS